MHRRTLQSLTLAAETAGPQAPRRKTLVGGALPGVTLVEAMVTVVVVAVAALGGLSYRYQAVAHGRIASAEMTATRTAQLVLEDWMSTGGSAEYDPATLGLGFIPSAQVPQGYTSTAGLGATAGSGAYSVQIDGLPMVVVLKYKDTEYDEAAEVKLRQLAVLVCFGEVRGNEMALSATWQERIRPIVLTTYVRVDAAGG